MSNNNDDPFAPSDATILRPRPGARRPGAEQPAAAAPPVAGPPPAFQSPPDQSRQQMPQSSAAPAQLGDFLLTGINPLIQSAIPLLVLAGRLRGQIAQADVESLRRQTAQEVQSFEQRARAAGIPAEDTLAARYALCTVLDEAVLNTPWGAQSGWAAQSLLVTFHREAFGGEKFFQILERVSGEPQRYLYLLELLYVCLALGFEGKYRVDDRGQLRLAEIRQALYARIQNLRGASESELSQRWKGVQDKRNAVVRLVPLWTVAVACLAILVGVFLVWNSKLNTRAEPLNAQLSKVGLEKLMASLPPGGSTDSSIGLRQMLAAQIASGALSVDENSQGAVVRLTVTNLFNSGTARLNPSYEKLIHEIAQALNKLPGAIKVIGHTDNQPLRSVEFKDNFELSRARAAHVAQLMHGDISNAARIESIGVGPEYPLYTPEGEPQNQARNRRVEIVYRRGS